MAMGLLLFALPPVTVAATEVNPPAALTEIPDWARRLQLSLVNIDAAHSGELGVYIKDMQSGATVSLRSEENWYLASGIKVPVAIAVFRDIERGKFSLDTKIRLIEADYVDGAGQTNRYKPGSTLSIRFLLEQMLMVSDNTASDMLIRLVGLEQVNGLIRELVPDGLGAITTLADVRRHAYSNFHADAFKLTGRDFLMLRSHRDERRRIAALAELLGVDQKEFSLPDMDSVFAAYYATNLNGGQLSAYGKLLEALINGEALQPETTAQLLDILFRTQTGKHRIKAGLPADMAFAHKTGTQHRRVCDLGVAVNKREAARMRQPGRAGVRSTENGAQEPAARKVVIAACSRDFATLMSAEATLKAVGDAVAESGLLGPAAKSPKKG